MAGLMQQDEVALRRAELGLREAEDTLDTLATTAGQHEFGTDGDEYYLPEDELRARVAFWDDDDFKSKALAGDLAGDAYVMEYLGSMIVPGETTAVQTGQPIPGGEVYVTRILVRSVSQGRSARIIESIYSTIDNP